MLSENDRKRLASLSLTGELEVEDLFRVLPRGGPDDIAFLRELAAGYARSRPNLDLGGVRPSLVVWVDVVCEFWSHEYAGLLAVARSAELRSFAVSLLGVLKTERAVVALLELAAGADYRLRVEIAEVFNLQFSFKSRVVVSGRVLSMVRRFLHALLSDAEDDSDRAVAVCALRGVGDVETMRLLERLPVLASPWEGAVPGALRAIRRLLK